MEPNNIDLLNTQIIALFVLMVQIVFREDFTLVPIFKTMEIAPDSARQSEAEVPFSSPKRRLLEAQQKDAFFEQEVVATSAVKRFQNIIF
jgi:hypothetical protein